ACASACAARTAATMKNGSALRLMVVIGACQSYGFGDAPSIRELVRSRGMLFLRRRVRVRRKSPGKLSDGDAASPVEMRGQELVAELAVRVVLSDEPLEVGALLVTLLELGRRDGK